ncbi:MAG: tryptophan synthase subunit alpha [Enterobacteriaceae bacterium PSmelAO3-2]|nr:tryptophan synthase subunit alpha [Enterobacteriaceae bacterium Cmel17]WMC17428.1 MAG: tryptophan synthase subunit alpha [Enterobacteriaceae bacterium Cmel21]WMC17634.1 MAG: tryptophan synthase subunit alpha [Enterobacteriaceae bacterium PSmelAO3-2]WMC17839.1 MAG: tryptophan synthase subunit alpha [Enterobacteriaceae bacterium PSmelAO3-1]WMC18042.1 MAG: tryptophan synthase subunit alpha [Enterobacteriaceae bacterium PSmelAO1]
MERYEKLFINLNNNKQGAFIPFLMLGDPNFNMSLKIIEFLILKGADALELGIPFSDPLADGIIIQNSVLRSFKSGITLKKCFKIISIIRKKYSNIPIGILTYANLVFYKGINNFYYNCQKSGIDSVLIADLPLEESKLFIKYSNTNNIKQVFICPPNSDDNLLRKISIYSKGYTYLLSRSGVTGTEKKIKKPDSYIINKLIEYNSSPIIQGFGIFKPSQVSDAIKLGISGVISGSAIIKIIEQNQINSEKMFKKLNKFIKIMKKSTFL